MVCLAGTTALAIAGCGSSSSSTTAGGTTAPTTQASTPATGATPAQTRSEPTRTPPSPGPANPGRAGFIRQADQICRAANTALLAPQRNVNTAFKAEQTKGSAAHRKTLAAAVRAESAVAASELTRLRSLSAPPADRLLVDKYLGAVASQVGLVNRLAGAVDANNGSGLSAIGRQLSAGKSTVDGLAAAYGFKVCGNAG